MYVRKTFRLLLVSTILLGLFACGDQPLTSEPVKSTLTPAAVTILPDPALENRSVTSDRIESAVDDSPAVDQNTTDSADNVIIETDSFSDPVRAGDYCIDSCNYGGSSISISNNAYLHLAANGSGFLFFGEIPYMLHWEQASEKFTFEDSYGYSFSGEYRNGTIEGVYGNGYYYVFSLNSAVPASSREITWNRSLPDGTVIEEIDADGNYYFHCREDCTPQDILSYFRYYYNLNEDNFACSFYSPETGEYCYYNDLTFMKAASTYKLPLNMYYYDQQAKGIYTDSTYVGGTTLDNAHYLSLVWSDNDVSEAMIYYLGDFYTYKKLMNENYGQLSDSELKSIYWSGNYYNTRFMMNTLIKLYWHMDSYSEMLNYMLQACPGEYLQLYSGDTLVAHKEGYFEQHIHDVGITFADCPFLIAVYTQDMPSDSDSYELIGRLNAAFISYQSLAMKRFENGA